MSLAKLLEEEACKMQAEHPTGEIYQQVDILVEVGEAGRDCPRCESPDPAADGSGF
jgi:hypothetical protein